MFFFNYLKNQNYIKKPLRVHSHTVVDGEKRTSHSVSCEGSMTVEAAIIFPMLLCAFVGILMWAKVFILTAKVDCALMETARQISRKEYILTERHQEGTGILQSSILFKQCLEQGNVADEIEISSIDFSGSTYVEDTKEIKLQVSYKVKLPLLLLGTWRLKLKSQVQQKAWNGYQPDKYDVEDNGNLYVYITEDGEVYHKDSQCYHLHVTIKSENNVEKYYGGNTSYKECDYCVDGKEEKEILYVTVEGDCYHENLWCSALTRRVSRVKTSEAGGRRPCKECV